MTPAGGSTPGTAPGDRGAGGGAPERREAGASPERPPEPRVHARTLHATLDGRHDEKGSGPTGLILPQAGRPAPAGHVDVRGLERRLAARLEGDVRFDEAHRGMYAHDSSNWRQPPIGVVLPRTKEDVVETVAACREFGAPVLGRGGGTSLAGQCCNVAVVLDFTRYMNRVLEIDPERRLARVEPGCILDDLRDQAEEHGLTFGPDPSTHDHCALGGMIGNNSCGVHSVHAQWHTGPRTSDNLHRLEVLTYDGARFWAGETSDEELEEILAGGDRRADIYRALRDLRDEHAGEIRARFPDIPRRVSGYNLDELLPENGFHVGRALAGTESTCVIFLEAELLLIPALEETTLVVVTYDSVAEAGDHVPEIMETKPVGLEALDHRLIEYNRRKGMHEEDIAALPEGGGWLLVQYAGDDKDEADRRARELKDRLDGGRENGGGPRSVDVFDDPEQEAHIWEVRESGLGATAFVAGMDSTWPGWEDSAVPPERLGDYLRDFRALLEEFDYDASFYGHFGQGLLHCRIDFDLASVGGRETYLRFLRRAADLVTGYGGSLSGEHGDGQARGALLHRMFGPRITDAFRDFKRIFDPDWRMNPGKVVDAYLPTENLVQAWTPRSRETYFRFPEEGSFRGAAMRCVGVGKCRRKSGGTMCPSYMVTLEEEHSTRGRARLLYEMLEGEVVGDGWRSDAVKEALDLCLSCKGCKGDCPVNVDMATYKSEFSAHYWAGRLRPRHAYAFGWIYWWARMASKAPRVVNWLSHTEPFARVAKWAAGVHPEREMPSFSRRTFRRRFGEERAPVNPDGRKVIFWADTFNNYFHADTAMAGARVLEALGYRVHVPERPLCCGRPLYDFGFLGMAKRLWRQILDHLEEDVKAGVPVVGVEPSCVAAFRDELPNLFPDDGLAERLSEQTFLLAEFLERYAPDVELPSPGGRALLHGHCHQKAVLDFDADVRTLERLGMEVRVPDSGCCGMAGPFGFEEAHYDVSQACAERVLLPEVRGRGDDTVVVTDGFSCREQILQNLDGVRPLNIAEVVWRALEDAGATRDLGRPRRAFGQQLHRDPGRPDTAHAPSGDAHRGEDDD